MNGKILINDYFTDFDAAPNTAADGRPYPETILSITLSGTNQSGEEPNRVMIRFRDSDRLAANPSISGSNIILDLPKHDFPMIQDLLQKSIIAQTNPLSLTVFYREASNNTWVNFSLR